MGWLAESQPWEPARELPRPFRVQRQQALRLRVPELCEAAHGSCRGAGLSTIECVKGLPPDVRSDRTEPQRTLSAEEFASTRMPPANSPFAEEIKSEELALLRGAQFAIGLGTEIRGERTTAAQTGATTGGRATMEIEIGGETTTDETTDETIDGRTTGVNRRANNAKAMARRAEARTARAREARKVKAEETKVEGKAAS